MCHRRRKRHGKHLPWGKQEMLGHSRSSEKQLLGNLERLEAEPRETGLWSLGHVG